MAAIGSVEASLTSTTSEHTSGIASLQSSITAAESSLGAAVSENTAAVNNAVSSITDNHNDLSAHVSASGQVVDLLASSLESRIGSEVNTVAGELESLEAAVTDSLAMQVQSLETQLSATQQQLNMARGHACRSLTWSDDAGCTVDVPTRANHDFPDSRTTSTSWSTVSARVYTVYKQGGLADTGLRVTWTDLMGFLGTGSSGTAADYRLLVNGQCRDGRCYKTVHSDGYTSWSMYSNAWTWWLMDLPEGTYEFEIQHRRDSRASRLIAGWKSNQENTLAVEELPLTEFTVKQHMPERRTTTTSFVDLPERVAQYRKTEADTDLHIIYSDTLGFNQNRQHTTACGFQALLYRPNQKDWVNLGSNTFHTHGGSGWQIWPFDIHYFAEASSLNLGPGIYTVKLQWYMGGGSSQILAGWPGSEANSISLHERRRGLYVIAPSPVFSSSGSRRDFRDIRTTSTSYTDLSDRIATHTKKDDSSLIRVTYMDTFGSKIIDNGQSASTK
ncbi:hypothetical protein PTSG_07326 [Salpingoeca rosetta]|uniref:Uncharacterized protein n=1 Tax=Salpingoeca rosetta (strain ATCC 50818 / BSB-021) TaxID=946362 RepID=F2UJ35_SALR5|nr:uncharacterized protein PTSG_07326 [Salpingoeca rosetta]EGD76983.1 hypothetical protein PTSG_07326 [Salpingoeca rosetta]|eukprot:XP_004990823.1 hypothetical protein PTSG_07326 [Salpingoeca rosetta]